MKFSTICTTIMLIAPMALGQPLRYAFVKDAPVDVFALHTDKIPQFSISQGSTALVVQEYNSFIKIRLADGREGWTRRDGVLVSNSSKQFAFDFTRVAGSYERPGPSYVLSGQDQDETTIELKRSFRDNLLSNIDKETAGRINNIQ